MINDDNKSLVSELNINSVQLSDAGVYQCGANIDPNNIVRSNTALLCIQGNFRLI